VADLETGRALLDAQGFDFVRAGNGTAAFVVEVYERAVLPLGL
jgi:hypothetical protein